MADTRPNPPLRPIDPAPGKAPRLFELMPGAVPTRRTMRAERALCVGPPDNLFLFGGVGLGAALAALEDVVGRPVVWATAQYLAPIRPEAVLNLDISTPVAGRSVTQARVMGSVDGREAFTVMAAMGAREEQTSHQWLRAPEIPEPDACGTPDLWPRPQAAGTLRDTLVIRVPNGPHGAREDTADLSRTSRRLFWMRLRDELPMDVSLLALFADFVPYALSAALGRGRTGASLDNTIRVIRRVPTTWVLCDAQVDAIHAGFAHGDIRLFAEGGELMAVGSQTINLWPVKTTEG